MKCGIFHKWEYHSNENEWSVYRDICLLGNVYFHFHKMFQRNGTWSFSTNRCPRNMLWHSALSQGTVKLAGVRVQGNLFLSLPLSPFYLSPWSERKFPLSLEYRGLNLTQEENGGPYDTQKLWPEETEHKQMEHKGKIPRIPSNLPTCLWLLMHGDLPMTGKEIGSQKLSCRRDRWAVEPGFKNLI
jgi:hypothetical protein